MQQHRSDGTVALFGNDDFGHAGCEARLFGVDLIPIDKEDCVGILLDRARLPNVGHFGSFVRTLFDITVELGQGNDRTFEFTGQ